MKTPHDSATEFLEALAKLEFKPGAFDNPNKRALVRKTQAGHNDLRILIAYEGERQPQSISLIKTNGQSNQLIEWESRGMSAHMPTSGLLALIKAA